MATTENTAPQGAPSALRTVPTLDAIREALDDESNVARLMHRMGQDMRENLPEGVSLNWQADLDALVSEAGRLEQRLCALAESLDVPGGAEIVGKVGDAEGTEGVP